MLVASTMSSFVVDVTTDVGRIEHSPVPALRNIAAAVGGIPMAGTTVFSHGKFWPTERTCGARHQNERGPR